MSSLEHDRQHGRIHRIERDVQRMYQRVPFPNYRTKLTQRYIRRFDRLYRAVGLPVERFGSLSVLDGGCGTGEESLNLARLGCRQVTGIDLSDASLNIARETARAHGLTNVRFVRGSLLDIPFAAESFDMVVSHGVIHHTAAPERALTSLVRVLKPGGYLSLFVYNTWAHAAYNVERFIVHRLAGEDLDRRVEVAQRLFGWRFRQLEDGYDLRARFYDQYAHPQASDHSIGQVLDWFRSQGLQYRGCYPPLEPRRAMRLFLTRKGAAAARHPGDARYPSVFTRALAQLGLLVLGIRDYSYGPTICGQKMPMSERVPAMAPARAPRSDGGTLHRTGITEPVS